MYDSKDDAKDKFIRESLNRIKDWSVETGHGEIPGTVLTAILAELRTMFDCGLEAYERSEFDRLREKFELVLGT